MARLVWGEGSRFFDYGVDQGVLYLGGGAVPWNGLVSVDEAASAETDTDYYYDGIRLWVAQETGDFQALLSAYTYPEVFAEYNGYSERELYRRFGFSYRTQYDGGYKIHVVYNAFINDDDRKWSSIAKTLDPSLFQWALTTVAVPIPGASPAARITIDVGPNPEILSSIEDILYGSETTDPRLPSPQELYEIYEAATLLRITYNGDGTYTATGPDDMVNDLGNGVFELTAPSVFLDQQDIFTVSSY